MRRLVVHGLAVAGATLFACNALFGIEPGYLRDSGTDVAEAPDAPLDSAPRDARLDSELDARLDSGLDARLDSSPDARPDSSPDANVDAGPCPGGMLVIPADTFLMGADDGIPNEAPAHLVTVDAFCMDVNEVTVASYAQCVSSGGCTPTVREDALCTAHTVPVRGNHPINCLTRVQAASYCLRAGKRLPTEEEWEYAARGTTEHTYLWGNTAPTQPLCIDRPDTCPVGYYTYDLSPLGLKDMAGSVSEWTSSGYSADYTPAALLLRDPNRPVFRGAAFSTTEDDDVALRVTRRSDGTTTSRSSSIGFRCAKSVAR